MSSVCSVCKQCGEEFTPNPRNRTNYEQEFCSARCRWAHWRETHPRVGVMTKEERMEAMRRKAEEFKKKKAEMQRKPPQSAKSAKSAKTGAKTGVKRTGGGGGCDAQAG